MTTFTSTTDQTESVFVGYFGRAGDPQGTSYWTNQLNNKTITLAGLAGSFAVQPEALAKYPYLSAPLVTDPGSFIDQVFLNLFNHTADPAGKAYWTAQLQAAGGNSAAVGQFILNVISGATGADDVAIRSKTEFSTNFTKQASDAGTAWTPTVQAQSSAELALVTTPATRDTQIAATTVFIATVPGPSTFFTEQIGETLSSNATNAAFNAPIKFVTGFGPVQTLQIGDSAIDTNTGSGTTNNGGTFTGTLATGAQTLNVTLTNIPTLNVTSTAAGSGFQGNITGVSTINNNNSAASLTIGATNFGIDAGGVAATATTYSTLLNRVNINNSPTSATNIFVKASALAGTADELSVNVTGPFGLTGAPVALVVGTDGVPGLAGTPQNAYEIETITASGATFATISSGFTGNLSTTTLNLKGAGSIFLNAAAAGNFTKLTTVNAVDNSGGVTITGANTATGLLAGNTVFNSFKGGSGADSLDISSLSRAQVLGIAAGNLDGGAGRDTVILSGAALGAAQTTTAINASLFEIVGVAGATTGTYNIANLGANIDTLALSSLAAAASTLTLSNVPNTTTGVNPGFTFAAGKFGNGAIVNPTGPAGTTDIYNVTISDAAGAGSNLGTQLITGFETVNQTISQDVAGGDGIAMGGITIVPTGIAPSFLNIFDNDGGNAVTFGGLTLNATGTINISGSGTGGLTTGAVTAGILNASGLNTGALATTAGVTVASAAGAITETGSDGADNLTGSILGVDTINGGAGNDILANRAPSISAGTADTLNGGTGQDTFIMRGDVASGVVSVITPTTTSVGDFALSTTATTTDIFQLVTFSPEFMNAGGGTIALAVGGQGTHAVQNVLTNVAQAIQTAGDTILKMDAVAVTNGLTTLQAAFNFAIGVAGAVTGITASNDLYFTLYDSTNNKMLVGLVQDSNASGTITAGDVVSLVGSTTMTASDYGLVGVNQFSSVFF